MPRKETPKTKDQPGPGPEDRELSREFDKFKGKSHEAAGRLGEIENTKSVLRAFLDDNTHNAIAYEMPLGEVLGFLEVREKEIREGNDKFRPPGIDARNITSARDFLVLLLDERNSKITEKSQLIEVMTRLEAEATKLADVAIDVAELE